LIKSSKVTLETAVSVQRAHLFVFFFVLRKKHRSRYAELIDAFITLRSDSLGALAESSIYCIMKKKYDQIDRVEQYVM